MNEVILKSFQEGAELALKFAQDNLEKIVGVAELIAECFRSGGKLLLFGNGGSAADAQHLAAEMVNRFLKERTPLPALALTTDTSVITSIANDYDYSEVFAKQIKALGKKGDIALGITTSGKSPNLIKAFKVAKEMGLITVAFTGKEGGEVKKMVDYCLHVDSSNTPRIQEVQILLGHILCQVVEERLFSFSEKGNEGKI